MEPSQSKSQIALSLATDDDASTLASIMEECFSTNDAIYPLIWGGAPPGTHKMVAERALFTPIQLPNRITYKAVESNTGEVIGFATWKMPHEKEAPEKEKTEKRGPPMMPEGVNTKLFMENMMIFHVSYARDMNATKDVSLDLLFVRPSHQRRGVGSLLLDWGKNKADEQGMKIFLGSTPKAVSTYEKNGWKIIEQFEIDLGKHGGDGIYKRYFMLREPVKRT